MRSPVDSRNRLRLLLGAVLLGLALPAWLLFRQASGQLDLEAFRRQQLIAEETVRRIDAPLVAAIAIEEARPFSDYGFAAAAGNVVQRSPLSMRPNAIALPGVIGHFQVDASGYLTTPLLPEPGLDPADYGISESERAERLALERRMLDVLGENRLVRVQSVEPRERVGLLVREPAVRRAESRAEEAAIGRGDSPALDELTSVAVTPESPLQRRVIAIDDAIRGQAAFDELTANSARQQRPINEDLTQDALAAAAPVPEASPAEVETEADVLLSDAFAAVTERVQSDDADALGLGTRVSTFDNDLEPLQFSRLDTGHFVLFRNAWRDGERFIQGILLDQDAFLRNATAGAFIAGGHATGTRMFASIIGMAPLELTPDRDSETLRERDTRPLYAARLSPPLAQIELAFRAAELPAGPADRVLLWTAFVLASVLLGGLYAVYRFGVQQIALTRQHQDFVSAVSHELKTPLTSIRMYGEMLKSGWVDDEKRQTYYDYIFSEGERLSRLIDNVLQIARLDRGSVPVTLEPITVGALLDVVRSKVVTTVERAGFTLTIDIDPTVHSVRVRMDQDAFVQVCINLVDNALKFSSDASRREIVLSAGTLQDSVLFCVRDFGPGIAPGDMKRLFELFYRPDNERTRATAGTGIGLALVKQLVTAMDGRVDVRNCDPGAEFRLSFSRTA